MLTGCGVASAQTTGTTSGQGNQAMNSTSSSANRMGNSMGNSNGSMDSSTGSMKEATVATGTPLQTGDVLVGSASSPMMGAGSGEFVIGNIRKGMLTNVPLATGANSLQVAITGRTAYVPTLTGETYVVDLATKMVTGHFATPQGARIGTIADQGKLFLVTGPNSVTAYALPSHMKKWQLNQGGNALTVAGDVAYLSGNKVADTVVVNLKTGKAVGTIPVGHIEDSVYDPQRHTLWLANWMNGDMTVVNTENNQVVTTIQEAEGGGFNMNNMMGSTGGFMQLAAGPNGKMVYAASFSGNIMAYNAQTNTFAKDIPVGSMAKLSGLAIDPSDRYAYVTVENKQETVVVSLATGKIVSTMQNTGSNRWTVID